MNFYGVFLVALTVTIAIKAQVNDKPDAAPFQNLLTKELGRMAKTVRKQLHSEMTELVEEIRLKFLQITLDVDAISENTSVEIHGNMLREKEKLEERFMKVVNYSSNRMEGLTTYLEYLDLAVKGHVDPYDLQNLLVSDAPIQNRKEREPVNVYSTDRHPIDPYVLYYTEDSSNVEKSHSYFNSHSDIEATTRKVGLMAPREAVPTTPRVSSNTHASNLVSEGSFIMYNLYNDLSDSTTEGNKDSSTFASAAAMRPDDLTMIFDNSKPRSCNELYQNGNLRDGIYIIYPEGPGGMGLAVRCVMEEGGWTVILARLPDVQHEEFSRPLHDYIIGFGKPQGHYWMGLRHVESMCRQHPQELKVYMQDWDGSNATAEYGSFSIIKVNESWALHVDDYHEFSSAGDSLSSQNGAIFSYKPEFGGWWHSGDGGATPTGKYYTQNFVREGRVAGVEWPSWKGDKISLKTFVIMIRPKT